MARTKKSSPVEDLLDLISTLPWWGGIALAVLSFIALHAFAAQTPIVPVQPSQAGQFAVRALWRSLAYYGQFILPLICVGGAALSAWRQSRRSELIDDVALSAAASALEGISWQEFEILVGEAFRLQGYQVTEIGGNGADGGVDLVLRKNGEKFLVQCKQWKAFKVGVDVVRELYGVMAAQGATGGFVVTSGRFTDAATDFSQGRNLKLIDGPMLVKLIRHAKSSHGTMKNPDVATPHKMATNVESAIPTCPRCVQKMVRRSAKRGANAGQPFWGCVSYPSCKGTRPID